jgi:hypothetical protein
MKNLWVEKFQKFLYNINIIRNEKLNYESKRNKEFG